MCSKNQYGRDNYDLRDYKSSESQIYQQALKDCSSQVKRRPLSFMRGQRIVVPNNKTRQK